MSRNKILQAIRANKPVALPLPVLPHGGAGADKLALFQERLVAAGGKSLVVGHQQEAIAVIREKFPEAGEVAASLKELSTVDLAKLEDPHSLESLDLAVFRGRLAVAENGGVWVDETESLQRVAPFIPLHLVLLVSERAIYANMHEAYRAIDKLNYGYGVFIAGPSKTADIEQSLVIGAHGPKSLLVLILKDEELESPA